VLSCYTALGIVPGMELARLTRTERGQASVELLGAVPAVLLVAALAWQLALAGQSAWLCAQAARAAARARVVGSDARRAARSVLPDSMRRGLDVEERSDGAVRVQLHVPILVRSWTGPLAIAATARLGDGG
jgi:pilus assembly protein CpaE